MESRRNSVQAPAFEAARVDRIGPALGSAVGKFANAATACRSGASAIGRRALWFTNRPEFETRMASDKVQFFNDLNFEQEVLQAELPVLVDFTATWCGPCKALAPIVAQLAEELDGKVKVGKLDVDDSPITAGKFGVRGVPTVMVFKNGQRAAQHVGLTTKQKLMQLVGL
jgi:thioredoxin 1